MAISKDKKETIIAELGDCLGRAKLTVAVDYRGLTVAQFAQLRLLADRELVTFKVAKNRLFKQALQAQPAFKSTPTDLFEGMLLYVFSFEDEVAGARAVAEFNRSSGAQLAFVTGLTATGQLLETATLTKLSKLAGREQLLAGIVARLMGPLINVKSGLQAPLGGLIQALKSK